MMFIKGSHFKRCILGVSPERICSCRHLILNSPLRKMRWITKSNKPLPHPGVFRFHSLVSKALAQNQDHLRSYPKLVMKVFQLALYFTLRNACEKTYLKIKRSRGRNGFNFHSTVWPNLNSFYTPFLRDIV